MRDIGIEGVKRGKKVKTPHGRSADLCPLDKVNRQFRASQPNQLWVSDFTFVPTWRGFVYVAFVIDTYANRIVGWKASTSQDTQFVLDALEQAIHNRCVLDCTVHPLDLAVGPWMGGPGQAMLDIVRLADQIKTHFAEGHAVAVPRLLGELDTIVSEDRMDAGLMAAKHRDSHPAAATCAAGKPQPSLLHLR